MRTLSLLLVALSLASHLRAQFTLVETRGTFRSDDTNLAPLGTALVNSEYGLGHFGTNINDGVYGNASSWIAGASNFSGDIGVGFSTPVTIAAFALGRDNTGTYADRVSTFYEFSYSTTYVVGQPLFAYLWTTVGTLNYQAAPPVDPSYRHLYNLDTPLTGVTGILLRVPGPINSGGYEAAAIDELELYGTSASLSAVPEPSTYAIILGAAALGLVHWRRRATT